MTVKISKHEELLTATTSSITVGVSVILRTVPHSDSTSVVSYRKKTRGRDEVGSTTLRFHRNQTASVTSSPQRGEVVEDIPHLRLSTVPGVTQSTTETGVVSVVGCQESGLETCRRTGHPLCVGTMDPSLTLTPCFCLRRSFFLLLYVVRLFSFTQGNRHTRIDPKVNLREPRFLGRGVTTRFGHDGYGPTSDCAVRLRSSASSWGGLR